MSIQKTIIRLGLGVIVLVIGLFVTLMLASYNQLDLNQAQETRYHSHLLATELRQSSEDLTRLARTYVVTTDSSYEDQYWNILAVRNGQKPRSDGKTISLQTLMKEAGFTEAEFAKLREAEQNSNSLVKTETIAMNAVKGLYDDGSGKYSKKAAPDFEMARRIMHDSKYHEDKRAIGKPIDEFEQLLNSRTKSIVDQFISRGNLLLTVIGLLVTATGILLFLITLQAVRLVRGLVAKLSRSSQETSRSSEDLLGTSQSLSSASNEQAAAIQQTVSSVEEVNAMVSRNAETARASKQVSDRSQTIANEGKKAIEEMLVSIGEIAESNGDIMAQVEQSNQRMSEIVQVIRAISEKTSVINDIVFQTRLLSFNASVEAARAGEQGKGFAVVAEEVGSLAQMSGQAASEIADMLSGSVQKVESIAQEMRANVAALIETGKTKLQQGTGTAQRCATSFEEVVESVHKLGQMINEISAASSEQATGVQEITKAMNQLDLTTQQNAQSAGQLSRNAEAITAQAAELDTLVAELSSAISQEKAQVA